LALTAGALVSMAASGAAGFDRSHPPGPMRHCISEIQAEATGDDAPIADNQGLQGVPPLSTRTYPRAIGPLYSKRSRRSRDQRLM
jgi:hypothetical protein